MEMRQVWSRGSRSWGRLEPGPVGAGAGWSHVGAGPVRDGASRSWGRLEMRPVGAGAGGARVGRSWGQLEPGPVGAGAAV